MSCKVEPIRDKHKIRAMAAYLQSNDRTGKYYLLFILGINTALRIGDLLKISYDDIFQENGKFREYVSLKEQKTRKAKKIKLNDATRQALTDYVKKHNLVSGEYFFYPSAPAVNKKTHIERWYAWIYLGKVANTLGIKNFGTHSLRKTFAYHYYKKTKDIGVLMELFNHANQDITMRYIGINQDKLDTVYAEIGNLYEDKE